jgi:hypothetical protein
VCVHDGHIVRHLKPSETAALQELLLCSAFAMPKEVKSAFMHIMCANVNSWAFTNRYVRVSCNV